MIGNAAETAARARGSTPRLRSAAPGERGLLPTLRRDLWIAFVAGERAQVAALWAVCVLGLAIRLAFLGQPMRFDEIYTFQQYLQVPLLPALANYNFNNHLLHTALAHVPYWLFGDHEWSIRLVAFVAGVLAIPVTYLVARALLGRNVALVAAALTAGSSSLIEFSTNARGYSLLTLLFLAAFGAAIFGQRRDSARALVVAGLISALGFFTVPTMAYAIAVIGCWLLLAALAARHPIRRLAKLLAAYAATTLAASAVLYAYTVRASGFATVFLADKYDAAPLAEIGPTLAANVGRAASYVLRDIPLPLAWLSLPLVALAMLWRPRLGHERVRLGLALFVPCLGLMALQRLETPARIWNFAVPVYWMLAAAGAALVARSSLTALRRPAASRSAAAIAAVVVVGAMSATALVTRAPYYSEETGALHDAPRIVDWLAPRLDRETSVLAKIPADLPLVYYFDRRGLDRRPLSLRPSRSTTLYLVRKANQPSAELLLAELLGGGTRLAEWSPPELEQAFDRAEVYALKRIAGTVEQDDRTAGG